MCVNLRRGAILGTGSDIPEKILTNKDIEKFLDTSDEWIRERTGICERRIAAPGDATSDLCLRASRRALDAAGLKPSDLDLIIVGTATPDMMFPSTAVMLQHKLGTKGQMAFDISAACSGFLYSMLIANQFISTGFYNHALVVGAEILSRVLDWDERSTCVLFGDGAGAVVLGPTTEEGRGILGAAASSDGSTWPLLNQPAGGSRIPASLESVQGKLHTLKMQGNEVFKMAVRSMLSMADEALKDAGMEPSGIDLLIPHQANLRIIEAMGKRLDIPGERIYVNVHKYGNTSAGSIPIALDEAVREGRVKPGDKILLDAFGAGATAVAAVVGW
ncbi:ketoacyl-ACP synthase III [bacterium]|nr:MAG: ketoacyl-ACP synthase III [bacterium]